MQPKITHILLFLLVLLQLHMVLSRNIYGLVDYGQHTVSDRLQTLGRLLDGNKDSAISPQELVEWARTLGRSDDSAKPTEQELNCVTQAEFEKGVVKAGFSEEYAKNYVSFLFEHSVDPPPTGCAGLDPKTVLDAATNKNYTDVSLTDFLNGFLKQMAEFCENKTDGGENHYSSNKDCMSLPNACASAPYGCEPVCLQYTFVTTKDRHDGAFSERSHQQARAKSSAPQNFAEKVISSFRDQNGNGVFSKDEQTQDYRANFDTNSDGCVEEAEFKARMSTSLCGGFDFDDAYSTAVFEQLKASAVDLVSSDIGSGTNSSSNGTCEGIYVNLPDGTDISKTDFINQNVQTLINLCEGNKKLYTTKDDCKQLSFICRVETETKGTAACKKYVQKIDSDASKNDKPLEDETVKFFKFVSKWGGKYQDYFGPKRITL